MDFCEKCGSVLVTRKDGDKTVLMCKKCKFKKEDYTPLEIAEKVSKKPSDNVIVIETNGETLLPKTRAICPQCGNKEAVWWIQQTRSSDEAPTLFLRCTKCKYSWREYG